MNIFKNKFKVIVIVFLKIIAGMMTAAVTVTTGL